jgi:putative glutamine amidotransferase
VAVGTDGAPVPILVTAGAGADEVVGGSVRALHLRSTYLEAVRAAGGVPVAYGGGADAAEVACALAATGGLLLTGGGDVAPDRYGQAQRAPLMAVDPERDAVELALARAALDGGVPVLGICRGMQVLAVAEGAPLLQDIASERVGALAHEGRGARREADAHAVRLEGGCPAGELLRRWAGGEEMAVNSFHHQAAASVPAGWRAFAWAPDGVLEGMERVGPEGAFAVGVQWHPEDRWRASAADRALFAAFVAAARRRLTARSGAV